jgi:putative aldouronate transport system substrate-binding protein
MYFSNLFRFVRTSKEVFLLKRRKKLVFVIVAAMMMSTLVMACASKTPESGPAAEDKKPAAAESTATESTATTYPIKADETLTYWGPFPGNLAGVKSTHAEVPFFQEWQKLTGVNLEFIAPAGTQAKEALNVMLASGELPDMIEYNFLKEFPGGPEKAIKDGYILKLNDLIDQHAPNLKKYLEEHQDVDKMIKTDSGSYYTFPFVRGDNYLMVYQGPIIRKDWLDELNLPVPETIDEWTTMLRAFKEQKGAVAPLSIKGKPSLLNEITNSGAFSGAFGVKRDFYIEDGQIKFGPLEKGYKDFLALFRSWYAEGLLDANFATVDGKALDANIVSGASGATVLNTGAGIGKWQPLIAKEDPKAVLAAAPYPVLNKGDTPKFGQKDDPFTGQGSVSITTKAKDPVLAVKLLDYAYSEEGGLFFNFGIEGVSYKMENGYPKYTDLIMNNPDKLAPAQAMSLHIRGNYNGPFIQDRRYMEQYAELPTQRESIEIWQKTDADEHKLPPISPTPEESSEFAKIMTDINTLVDEMTLKIILGTEPVDSFEKYVDRMKSLKIDRAIEIQEAALDRYNNR